MEKKKKQKQKQEMDSSVELGPSGELLDGQTENEQKLTSDGFTPRINTEKLE
jgi:hypothetical protein